MLGTLRRIVQEVSRAADLPHALETTVQCVAKAMRTEVCTVYLRDVDNQCYRLAASVGFPEGCQVTLGLYEGLVGFVGEKAEPLNVSNASQHPHYCYVPETQEERFNAFLGVPIIHQRKVLGVLTVQQREARKFNESEEAFLITLAAQLAGVIAVAHTENKSRATQKPRLELDSKPTCVGSPSAPGIALGTAVLSYSLVHLADIPDRLVTEKGDEKNRFRQAIQLAKNEIENMQQRLKKSLPSDEHSVFHLYLQLLESPTWINDIEAAIDCGFWAPSALRDAVQKRMAVFEDMHDTYLQERSNDIADLANRVLKKLLHCQDSQSSYPDNTILVGYDISVSSLAEVPEEKLAGIISVRGSPNSHVAILARAMGIPFITGAVGAVSVTHEGDPVIVNGYTGHYYVSPHPSLQSQYQALAKQEEALDNSLQALKDLPAETLDGHRVHMLVNTGFVTDIQPSLAVGAEGVGLYRTEVPFLIRDRFPSEEEQYRLYRQLFESFHPRKVTVRTLDVGGDKPLPYFSVAESNPSLGWRGLRMTLDHPEILMVQLRALFRASDGLNNIQIMFPMISQVSEVKEAIGFVQQAYDEILEEGADIRFPPLGAMLEVPGVVCLIPHLAQYLNFFSVGSNDLTQYLLAVDRNNTQVTNLYDIFHPSVVHTLYTIVKAAHVAGKSVGLCGEMAADPAAVLLLLGMGFDSLSVHATRLPRIKWVIRNMTYQKAQALVEQALKQEDATAIRQLLHQAIEEAGLEGLMYVGKPL